MRLNAISLTLGLVSAAFISGCNDDATQTSGSTPSGSTTYSVTAIDGYLRNARVWLDINGNYLLDEGEPSGTSGVGGVADLDVTGIENPEKYPVVVQAIAGQTEDEDNLGVTIQSDYVMSAPPGEKDVTPLTTLVHVLLEQNTTDSDDAAAVEAAKQSAIRQVADQLGIDESKVLGDFVESGTSDAAYAAENLVDSNVLPSTPSELDQVTEESASNSQFIRITTSVNDRIKKKIIEVAGEPSKTFDNIGGATEGLDLSSDDDQDGVPNDLDQFPNDPNETLDSDGDGVGNNADLNDDTVDGLDDIYPDTVDIFPTDRARAGDHDADGVDSILDLFPQDASEWSDADNDGVGDNADAFDTDPNETTDTDGDGVGDNADAFDSDPSETTDSDGDGVGDNADAFDNDPSETTDTDGDGVGDNADAFDNDPGETTDSDGDGVGDNTDAFDNDPNETADTDGDGVGDNADAFDNDPSETTDSDGDGVGDNADAFDNDPNETTDSDGDGVGDNSDAFPSDPTETVDADGDGLGDNEDDPSLNDKDNDGVKDGADNCVEVANADQADDDGDGIGNVCDSDVALTWDNTNWDQANWQ